MNNFTETITKLKIAFTDNPLPGEKAQLSMSPVTRKMMNEEMRRSNNGSGLKKDTRKSAVLILFYPIDNIPHIAMIKRAPDNTVHSGQISFPGGKVEKIDGSLEATALREANEEVGIMQESVKVIGQLTKLYIPPSNFDVFPFVGYSDSRPNFVTNHEVDKLMEVKLSDLLDANNRTYNTITHRDGNEFVVPSYSIQDEVIWGATGMILGELMEVGL